jgi:predicted acylesterase/phospholipase RssA
MRDELIGEFDTLVLSGGSHNGLILLGGIQYLYDKQLVHNITTFVGTSIGGVISYLLIIGYTPIEIMVYICTHNDLIDNMRKINFLNITRGDPVIPFSYISDEIEKMTLEKIGTLLTMADLRSRFGKTLVCPTYNITNATVEYISVDTFPTMPCLTALRMTCNLPFVFDNFKQGESFYIDGALSNNFPIDIGEKLGKKVAGLCITYDLSIKSPKTDFLDYMYKLLYIPIQQSMESRIHNKRGNTAVININIENVDLFTGKLDHKVKFDMFSRGYNCGKEFYEREL